MKVVTLVGWGGSQEGNPETSLTMTSEEGPFVSLQQHDRIASHSDSWGKALTDQRGALKVFIR